MFGLVQNLSVVVCKSVDAALEQGFSYALPEYKAICITNAVVVRGGTKAGNATVDLLLEDESGQKYVCMITGNLLKSIPC